MIFHAYQKDIKNLTRILSMNSGRHYWKDRTIKLSRNNTGQIHKLETTYK